MAEEDRTLSLGRRRIRTSIRLTNLKVGLDIDVGALFESAEILVRLWAEGKDGVPCRLAIVAGYKFWCT